MLWVLKRTVSMRRSFWIPKAYVKTDGLENIHNLLLKNCYCERGESVNAIRIKISRTEFQFSWIDAVST